MVIEIATKERLQQGLCEALQVEKKDLESREICSLIQQYIFGTIEKVQFCHLARYIKKPNIIYPLNKALIENTDLKIFLNQQNITFEKVGNYGLKVKYNNKEIDVSKCARLRERFRDCEKVDQHINGYYMLKKCRDSDIIRYAENGPEFLYDLGNVLGKSLQRNFSQNSKAYQVICEVGIEDLWFETPTEKNTKNEQEKTYMEKLLRAYKNNGDTKPIFLKYDKIAKPIKFIQL